MPVPAGAAGEATDDTVDLGADAESAELRATVDAALAGLDPSDREIIELNLRHELDGQDLADVLGVRVRQAEALVSRARARFELDPAMLLGMLPAAVPPASLRGQLFDLAGDASPVPSAYRAGVISRAGPFRRSGFPVPLDPPPPARRPVIRVLAAGTGVAALAVTAGGSCSPRACSGHPHRMLPARRLPGRPVRHRARPRRGRYPRRPPAHYPGARIPRPGSGGNRLGGGHSLRPLRVTGRLAAARVTVAGPSGRRPGRLAGGGDTSPEPGAWPTSGRSR